MGQKLEQIHNAVGTKTPIAKNEAILVFFDEENRADALVDFCISNLEGHKIVLAYDPLIGQTEIGKFRAVVNIFKFVQFEPFLRVRKLKKTTQKPSKKKNKEVKTQHLIIEIIKFLAVIIRHKILEIYYRSLLQKHSIKEVFITTDRGTARSHSSALVKSARDLEIPLNLVVLAMPNSGLAIRRYLDVAGHYKDTISKFLLTFIQSKKEIDIVKKGQPFFYPRDLIALFLLKNIPKNPWLLGGSAARYIYVNNNLLQQFYMKQHIKKEHIKLFKSFQDSLIRPNKLKQNKKRNILVSLPPLWEHQLDSKNNALKFYAAVFSNLSSYLVTTKLYQQIIFSLHPKQNRKTYEEICTKYGIQISCQNITNDFENAAVFVVSNSTTINVAVQFEVPVLYINLHDLDNFYFLDMASVIEWDLATDVGVLLDNIATMNFEKNFAADKRGLSQTEL